MTRPRSDGKLAGRNLLLDDGFLDELLGQFGAFARSDHPAGDVAAEDIEDHVEIEVGPLHGTSKLGDIPAPELVGRGGQQLGFPVRRMDELIATFAGLSLLLEDAVHGADRTEVLAFVEQGGLHGGGGAVLEALLM